MGYREKKVTYYSKFVARFAFAFMAISIALQFIIGGVTLKLIKFPLIGGEIQFEKKEELPDGTIKVALNEAKYIFNDDFILRVRPRERGTQTDNSFNVSFYKFSGAIPINDREYYRSTDLMTPGNILSIKVDDLWYHARMLQIKKEGENLYCYFHVYTSKEDVPR